MTTQNSQDVDSGASNKQSPVGDNIDSGQLAMQLLEKRAQPVEETPEEVPEEVEAEAEETVDEVEGAEAVEEDEQSETEEVPFDPDEVLSKFNLEDMSEDELAQLGEAVKSKVPKRFGELTAKRKTAEEERDEARQRAAYLEQQLQAIQQKDPFTEQTDVQNNPFSKIDNLADLEKQYQDMQEVQEWADALLDDNEDSSLDDVIATEGGKELTKREVKKFKRDAKQATGKYLKARWRELQADEVRKQQQSVLINQAKAEISWMAEEESEAYKAYQAVAKDPIVAKIRENVPEIAPRLDYILAHAINSVQSQQQKKPKSKVPAKRTIKPPSGPPQGGSRGGPSAGKDIQKQIEAAKAQVQKTGKMEDFEKLRALQRSLK